MDLTAATAFIELVSSERDRRKKLLPNDADAAYDQWVFGDLPFLSDLCILYLIALRHHVERQLLFYAACATGSGGTITRAEFEAERTKVFGRGWCEVKNRLKPDGCKRCGSVEALRLLANSYKHDCELQPSRKLLLHLSLDPDVCYATIPESDELRRGLARFVQLQDDASFTEITRKFVDHVLEFLADIKRQNTLSTVEWGPVSFLPKDLAR